MGNGVYPVWKPGEELPPDITKRLSAIEENIVQLRRIFDALVGAHAELQSAFLNSVAGPATAGPAYIVLAPGQCPPERVPNPSLAGGPSADSTGR